ncbi:MAG: hypothetical protein WCF67_00855, partial [Chitinophagaceae bacterium]
TITDKQKGSYCQVFIMLSTKGKGNIKDDFDKEWETLIAKQYTLSGAARFTEPTTANGWTMKSGMAPFTFSNATSTAMLTTMSGYDKTVSIVSLTNSADYLVAIQQLLASVEMKKPGIVVQPVPVNSKFAFNTTNFDDGWTSTVQEDWVEVTKGTIRVLIHYPNKIADAYNHVVLDGLKNAWNVLVAPKYSTASNFQFRASGGWESIEYAEADAVEKSSGKQVHVVLFKKNFHNGGGKYLEVVTPGKRFFEQEFGGFQESSSAWEKMEKMANYNKFAVAASDLLGKWTNQFSGAIQYVNAYTGLDAGMNTHASAEQFKFIPGNTYAWDLGVASGAVGNIKFQSAKSTGKFAMTGNWQINLSDIEGKPRTYNVHFSCIKGLRILWIDNRPFAKVE